MKPSNSKEEKPRLILNKATGLLWCPCGHGPIGNTSLMYETVETRTPAGQTGRLITRSYYLCGVCKKKFDLKPDNIGWSYVDAVERSDRVKLESPEDFNKAAQWIKDSTNLILSAQIADSKTKGYKFHCGSTSKILKCHECGQALVAFITLDLDEAFQHSIRNNTPMWIAKDE